jgi:hypothetical protein
MYGTLALPFQRAARLKAGGEGIVDGLVRRTWCTEAGGVSAARVQALEGCDAHTPSHDLGCRSRPSAT